jgi:hypothetical protein
MTKEDYFSTWLRAATDSARDWWEGCKRASAERRSRGGPTLAELWVRFDSAGASIRLAPDFADDALFDTHADLAEAIEQETTARGTFAQCLNSELDRTLRRATSACARSLRAKLVITPN